MSAPLYLGLDPGRKTGFGIIQKTGSQLTRVTSGVIKVSDLWSLEKRLGYIFQQINLVLDQFHPQSCGIEEVFFAKNARSAIQLSHVRGVLLLAMELRGIAVFQYTPTLVKKALTSSGRAEKNQVMKMVQLLLHTQQALAEDESDALAIAICHSQFNHSLNR